jgi:serine/threonine protein kinase
VDKKTIPLSHRDLKDNNIFCENNHCVIGDFDHALSLDSISGTPGYFSPETLDFVYLIRDSNLADEGIEKYPSLIALIKDIKEIDLGKVIRKVR